MKRRVVLSLYALPALAAVALILFRNTENWIIGRGLYLYGLWFNLTGLVLSSTVGLKLRRRHLLIAAIGFGLLALLTFLILNRPHGFNECPRPRFYRGDC